MESIILVAFWAVFILVGLSILAIAIFGLRSTSYGKISPLTAGIVAVPLVLLVVLGFVLSDWDVAGIITIFIMLGLGAIALLASGVRSLLGM